MAGELVGMLEVLPAREMQMKAELERIIVQELGSFLRVGFALSEISSLRLYRDTHDTFKEYLRDVWDLSETYGYDMINAKQVVDLLEQNSANCGGIKNLPKNEAQVRPLVKYKDDPETLEMVWGRVIDLAPEGKVTAKLVKQTLFDVVGKKTTNGTSRTRAAVNKDKLLSDDFKIAFESMVTEIERAKIGKYRDSSREAILKHLDALRETVASDGNNIPDHTIKTKTDRAKLIDGGFRIIRKNEEHLFIEEQTHAGFWEHIESCSTQKELDGRYNILQRDNSYLRG